jgi:integrase
LLGVTVEHIRDTPRWAIELFMQTRLAEGMKPGHARNTVSAIRVVVFEAGGGSVDTTCSNAAIGIPQRDRSGARRAYTRAELDVALERARQVEGGLAHIIALMYLTGLRSIEALRCPPYLAQWLALLQAGASELPLAHGAKTNRPRKIEIVDALRADTMRAIESALEHCKTHDGRLITGRQNTSLKSARHRLRTTLRAAGLIGKLSSHGLRYSYAVNLAVSLLDKHVSPEAVLDRVSASLGHGQRAVMILNTYLTEIRERFALVVIPRPTPRDPARSMRERHLPAPLRSTRSNRTMQFRK